MQTGTRRHFFGRNASVLLDVLRFGAALTVALVHMPVDFVRGPLLISEHAGNTAVCVFFVLSGFVIRYITVTRVTTASSYFIDRASRIYSVVLPILVWTVVLDLVSMHHAPAVYRTVVPLKPLHAIPGQLLEAVTFTTGWLGYGDLPLSNGPFWSLPFECAYYVLFGLLAFAPRLRWVCVPLLLLATGPAIALLFPVWLLGVALYDAYAALHDKRYGVSLACGFFAAYATLLWLSRDVLRRWLEASSIMYRQAWLAHIVAPLPWAHTVLHGEPLRWLDRFSPSYFLSGTLLPVAMLPVLLGLDRYAPAVPKRAAAGIRLVADSTFTLYLLHKPFFLFVICMAGGQLANWGEGFAMLLAAIALSILLGRQCDRLKNLMRAGMHRGSTAFAAAPATR